MRDEIHVWVLLKSNQCPAHPTAKKKMFFFKHSKSRAVMLLLCTSTIIAFVYLNGQTSSNPFWGLYTFVHGMLDDDNNSNNNNWNKSSHSTDTMTVIPGSSEVMTSSHSNRPCSCHKCMTEPENDPWFVKRLQQSLSPFVTRANKQLPGNTVKWWKTLQHDRGNFTKAVEDLFRITPDKELYMDAGPDRCRTCAVVGNSGNLKGSHYGAHIDLNDVIIRINKAHTKGFEEDVGTRTTHHIMYPESAVDLDNTTHLVLFPFKTLDLQWLLGALTTGSPVKRTYAAIKYKIKANKDLVLVLHPTFMKYVHEIWLEKHGRYPSTGFMALISALHICDEVNVYGFGADRFGNWNHYWDPLPKKALPMASSHSRNHEHFVISQLFEKQKIQLFKGLTK